MRLGVVFAGITAILLSVAAFAQPLPSDADCDQCRNDLIRDLKKIIDAGTHERFGNVAAAVTRRSDAEHDALLKKRGCGTVYGNHGGSPPSGVNPPPHGTDCTTFVIDTLRDAFAAQGKTADWNRVFAKAMELSGPGGFKGTALQRALESELGWKGMYWAGDLDADAETKYGHYLQKKNGEYYKVKVDPAHAIVDFKKPGVNKNFEALKKIPFGVLATKGGMHMGLVVNGQLYEVHWSTGCESTDVIAASDFKDWYWSAGAIVAPAEDVRDAFGGS